MPEHTSGQAEKGFAIFRGEVLYLRLSQPPQGGDLGGDTGQLAGVVPLLPLDPWVREEVGGIGLDHKPILWNPSGYLGQFFGVFIGDGTGKGQVPAQADEGFGVLQTAGIAVEHPSHLGKFPHDGQTVPVCLSDRKSVV